MTLSVEQRVQLDMLLLHHVNITRSSVHKSPNYVEGKLIVAVRTVGSASKQKRTRDQGIRKLQHTGWL